MGALGLLMVCNLLLRNLPTGVTDRGDLFRCQIEELCPLNKRLYGPRQCLPVLWTTWGAALKRFVAINWRTRGFSLGGFRISRLLPNKRPTTPLLSRTNLPPKHPPF